MSPSIYTWSVVTFLELVCRVCGIEFRLSFMMSIYHYHGLVNERNHDIDNRLYDDMQLTYMNTNCLFSPVRTSYTYKWPLLYPTNIMPLLCVRPHTHETRLKL